MDIEGLDYNTGRGKLRLMAYGRDIQQMVDHCVALPTKAERQRCAESIIDIMKRVVPSQLAYRERMPALWYHLALMSDFKLDIDYPVDIVHEDKMAIKPERIEYTNKRRMPARHYGRLLLAMTEKLRAMEPGGERDALAAVTANQMHRSLAAWGMGSADKERVASDMARLTDGAIQLDTGAMSFDTSYGNFRPMGANAMGDMMGRKKKKRRK